jgi:hypothetical protein
VTASRSSWDASILDGSGDCRGEAHALQRELEGYGLRVRIVLGPPLTHPGAPLDPDDVSASVTLLREPLDLADGRASRIVFVLTVAPAAPCGIAVEAGVLDEDDVRPLARLVAEYLGRPVPTDRL